MNGIMNKRDPIIPLPPPMAFTYIRGKIDVKQLSDRCVQLYSDYTVLAFAISLFPLLLRGGLPPYKDISLLNFSVIGNL